MPHPLREFRDREGLTQSELGARIGKSKFTVSKIENGKQGLPDALIRKLVAETGISADALLQIDDAPDATGAAPIPEECAR